MLKFRNLPINFITLFILCEHWVRESHMPTNQNRLKCDTKHYIFATDHKLHSHTRYKKLEETPLGHFLTLGMRSRGCSFCTLVPYFSLVSISVGSPPFGRDQSKKWIQEARTKESVLQPWEVQGRFSFLNYRVWIQNYSLENPQLREGAEIQVGAASGFPWGKLEGMVASEDRNLSACFGWSLWWVLQGFSSWTLPCTQRLLY